MATKRRSKSGNWEFIVKRSKLLPKPIYLTFTDETEGDTYVRRLEQLLDAGIVPPEFQEDNQTPLTLAQAIRQYQATVAVSAADGPLLGVLLERLGDQSLVMIDYDWVEKWIMNMKRLQNLAPSTIRHYVGALARCLDWVTRKKIIPGNPLRLLPKGYAKYTDADVAAGAELKEDIERDRRLEHGEHDRILKILSGEKPSGRQRALELNHRESLERLYLLALETAMRLNEMYTLDVGQVDLARRTAFLDRSKNGSKRQVPLSSVAIQLLRDQTDGKPSNELVFPWWDGVRAHRKETTALLSAQFARIFEAAGCEDLHFHDLRHEATCRLYERTTLSDLQISKITGHKDMRMLQRYANLRGSTLADRMW